MNYRNREIGCYNDRIALYLTGGRKNLNPNLAPSRLHAILLPDVLSSLNRGLAATRHKAKVHNTSFLFIQTERSGDTTVLGATLT